MRAAAVAAAGKKIHHVGAVARRVVAADRQVARGAGRRGEELGRNRLRQCVEHGFRNSLGYLSGATRHGARIACVKKGALRIDDAQRLEGAGADRHFGEHMLHREIDGAARRGDHGIHRPAARRRGAGEVEFQVAGRGARHLHADVQRLVHHAVGIHDGVAVIAAFRNAGNLRAHLLRGAAAQFGDRFLDHRGAVAVEQRREALLADRERGRLRLDVADALVGDADVRQDDGEDFLVHHALLVELHRRQPQAFLLHLGGVGRKAAGDHAAQVRPVAGIGEPAPVLAAVEERFYETHVHQVRAAEVGVVDDEQVVGLERDVPVAHVLDHRARAELHRADKHRQPEVALRDERAVLASVDAVRAVHALGNHRAERGAAEREVHLVAHLLQPVLDDGEADGIERAHGRSFDRTQLTVTSRLPEASASA